MAVGIAFPSNPDELLREATSRKEAGDLADAVSTLRRAYAAIKAGDVSYPVETFLRLPAYLQHAGHSREAWQVFKDLLDHGYSRQYTQPELLPMDHSAIYDKMRLFLQRASLAVPAVAYGILAHCSWAIGLERQHRTTELQNHISRPVVDKIVAKLLRKAGRGDAQQALCSLVADRLRDVPSLRLHELHTDINALLCVQTHEYA
jgi:hypothetical protein